MNDNDRNILDVWLNGEGTVRATNAISDPDKPRHADTRRLSIFVSGSIDTDSHPWAKTFKKIDVTLYFSDEIPADDGCAFLSASEICLEGDLVYRDSLDIEAFLPTASFTTVSQILTASRTKRPMLLLLTDYDIAAWAAQDVPELLKAQECAFEYDPLAANDEQTRKEVDEKSKVDRNPSRWRPRNLRNAQSPLNGSAEFALVVMAVLFSVAITVTIYVWIS